MPRSPFDPSFDDLPQELPIFPLKGVLLLPGGGLPLNIFEKRYLAMTRTALRTPGRLIGMVQPTMNAEAGTVRKPEVYATGCAGRIVAFQETADERYMITLAGLIRFGIKEELEEEEGYRRVVPDWSLYRADLEEADSGEIDRERLIGALKAYFHAEGVSGDVDSLQDNSDEKLVALLAMHCPFAPGEKQALLEAPSLEKRAEAVTTLMEMAALDPSGGGDASSARH